MNDKTKQLQDLIKLKLDLDEKIKKYEKVLEDLVVKHKTLETATIPEHLASMGVTELTLEDGTEVKLQEIYNASISEERSKEAYSWLRSHGHASLIKTKIACDYNRTQQEEVDRVTKILMKAKVDFTVKDSIHYQTLKSWVKEMCEGGESFPHDTFGVFMGKKAKITISR
jgi:hypothetical protein